MASFEETAREEGSPLEVFLWLPEHLLLEIVKSIPPGDPSLSSLSFTCRTFRRLAKEATRPHRLKTDLRLDTGALRRCGRFSTSWFAWAIDSHFFGQWHVFEWDLMCVAAY